MQGLVLRHPDCAAPARQPVVEDDGRDLAPFTGARAVPQEEALAIAAAVLVDDEADPFLVGAEPAGDELRPGMAGIDDGFELRGREEPFGHGAFRERRHMGGDRGRDGSHRDRLDQRGGMFAGGVEDDAAWPIREIDPGLFGERRGRVEDLVGHRRDLVARGRAEHARGRGGLGADAAEQRHAAATGGGLFRLGRERQALGHPELAEQLADVRTLDGDAVPLPHALVEHVQAHRYAGPMLAVGVGQPNRRADNRATACLPTRSRS